jgi:hypothetical protein
MHNELENFERNQV